MHFHSKTAKTFIPDGTPIVKALARTTHLAITAHQDDIEMMATAEANATFSESHETDTSTGLALPMDMSPLIFDDELEPLDLVQNHIKRFAQDVYYEYRSSASQLEWDISQTL